MMSIVLGACAETDIPHYSLDGATTKTIRGGDQTNYSVVAINATTNNDASGVLSQTYQAIDLFTPNNETLETFELVSEVNGSFQYSFANAHFFQSENGNLTLQAFSESGETFWLINEDKALLHTVFRPANFNNTSDDINSGVIPLFSCENDVCSTSGSTQFSLSPLSVETVETEYAIFDSYKVSIQWEISMTLQDSESTIVNYFLSGQQWIHPNVGVVKFSYQLESGLGINTLIGSLNSTNIEIPSSLKIE